MNSQKRSTVVFGILFATAVLFFIGILIFATLYDEDGTARVPDKAMVITEMNVNVEWNKDRSCKITQDISVEFVEPRHGIYVDIPVNSGERVRNLEVTANDIRRYPVMYEVMHEAGGRIVRVKVGDPDWVFDEGERLYCTVGYDYITPEHPDGKDILDINAIGSGWACEIKSASVSVTFPEIVQSTALSVWVGDGQTAAYTQTNDGKTITVTAKDLAAFTGVRVRAVMSGGLEDGEFEGLTTVIVGVVLVAAVVFLMLFLGRDKPLTPVVGFYPPQTDGTAGRKRRMLPVQLGKIIDGKCSSDRKSVV